MAKKIGKHLQFYIDCHKNKELPGFGLCYCARHGHIDSSIFELFEPTICDEDNLIAEGHDLSYWASGDEGINAFKFTPLRQSIILFMAAINGEL